MWNPSDPSDLAGLETDAEWAEAREPDGWPPDPLDIPVDAEFEF